MTRDVFIDYLVANGCEIVRIANQGYHVMRNIETKKMSGVPVTDPPLDATVCRICKNLDVEAPKESAESGAKALIDQLHDKFTGEKKIIPEHEPSKN